MSKVSFLSALLLCALGAGGAGCAKSGMGAEVRTDISGRMQSAEPSISTCYATALQRSRKLKGMIVLSITAASGSGQFKNITVTRDEIGDTELKTCVIGEVGKQKLEKPPKTNITFTYPLRFSPTK